MKNVTAAYSRTLDDFVLSHPGYLRNSSGRSEPAFLPDPAKTFNRGFTRHFISGQREKIASMDTPKSIGQPVGSVTGLGKGFFQTDYNELQNGDGLCFFTRESKLAGFRVERVENSKVFPNTMEDLAEGIVLYRNHSIALTRLLNKVSSRRQIHIKMGFKHDGNTVRLIARDEDGNGAELILDVPFEEPRDPLAAREQVQKHILRTGNTPFKVVKANLSRRVGFLPISFLNDIRRQVLEKLVKARIEKYPSETTVFTPNSVPYPQKWLDFHANVMNEHARLFYKRHGAEVLEPAFEVLSEITGREVMRTRYCIRYELDACLKCGRSSRQLKEPLRITDRRHAYLLKFDCEACRMSLIFCGRK